MYNKSNWDDDDYLAKKYEDGMYMDENEFKEIQKSFGYEYSDDDEDEED